VLMKIYSIFHDFCMHAHAHDHDFSTRVDPTKF